MKNLCGVYQVSGCDHDRLRGKACSQFIPTELLFGSKIIERKDDKWLITISIMSTAIIGRQRVQN